MARNTAGHLRQATSWRARNARTVDRRNLPPPTVRVAFAAIEKSDRFGARAGRWVQRLGIRDTSQFRCWPMAPGGFGKNGHALAGATEVLDVYHALEKVSQTADALYGEASDATRQWLDTGRTALLRGGWRGMRAHLDETKKTIRKAAAQRALKKLGGYLGRQPEHCAMPSDWLKVARSAAVKRKGRANT